MDVLSVEYIIWSIIYYWICRCS